MQVFKHIDGCRAAILAARQDGLTVGLVPTMGALHEGHLSLVRAARQRCDRVAVTIFVNPTQFAPREDFAAYPRPVEEDLATCRKQNVDYVFTPDVQTMYPVGASTTIHLAGLVDGLCGPFRPGHFDGVATVVAKLFHILPADVAYFGEKDYQQLVVIRQMVRDLDIPIEIVGCPTIRERDGLAMSSRNAYLSPTERKQAVVLSRALFSAVERINRGDTSTKAIRRDIQTAILAAGSADIDYVEVVDAETLKSVERIERPARICLAVRIGATRLIDNVPVDPPPRLP